jgi:DNA polymerase I-like protein with 3'-5' exonuclease and polymerase domains
MSLQPPLFPVESDWRPPMMGELPTNWGSGRFALDIETCDPQLKKLGPGVRRDGYIVGVSFAVEGQRAFYLPIRHLGGDNMPCDAVLYYLRDMAKNFTGEVVGANFQYDLDFLAEEGIVFPKARVRDVQIADPVLYELHSSYSLDNILKRWGYDEGKDESALVHAAKEFGVNPKGEMWKLPARHVGPYAEGDVDRLCELIARQEAEIDRQGLREVYELESKLLPVLLKMRRRGVAVDQDQLDRVEAWALEQEREVYERIKQMTGVALGLGDINKKKALVPILDSIGVRLKTTATGQPQIDKALFGALDHPVGDALNHARKVNKLRTTFVKSVRSHLTNGRLHCTFNQMRAMRETGEEKGARYGRLSCSNPNLQQQPSRDAFAKMWRAIYVPDHGLWCSADYSQQEPRMLVHFAELVGLTGAFEAAERYRNDPRTDNHAMMTQMVYPDLTDEHPTWKKRRGECKQIFLGLCYQMGSGKLAEQLGLPTQMRSGSKGPYLVAGPEGQRLFDLFDEKVPFVRKLARKCEIQAKRRGYIRTIKGRRCRFPVAADGSFDWAHKALNRLIQGSSADQTKQAMVSLDEAGHELQLQVHDEVCLSVEGEDQARDVANVMRTCIDINVPSHVDIELGPNWGEAEEID